MEATRRPSFASALATFAFVVAVPALAATGCHASASASTGAPPPATPVASAEPTPPPPPPDRDGDGIADADDKCPDTKGVKSDDPAKNGCPAQLVMAPAATKRVMIDRATNRLVINEKIMFKLGSAAIDPSSDSLLDEIAQTVKMGGKDIDLIEVAGHADKQGDVKSNLKLTNERAAAVVKALEDRGVDAKKLRAKGYSSYCPVDPNDDEKNRRVEFVILKAGGKPTGAATGCEAATKAGVKPEVVK